MLPPFRHRALTAARWPVTPSDRRTGLHVGELTTASVLAALTLAVMIPRLRSAQFGLLDDGVTMYVSRALGHALGAGDPGLILRLELERGRFRPLCWLFANPGRGYSRRKRLTGGARNVW